MLRGLNTPRGYLLFAAASVLFTGAITLAQTGPSSSPATGATLAPTPSFDVVTIKPHPAGPISMTGVMKTPDGATGTATIRMLIEQAFGLQSDNQVVGAPDWTKTDWFDLQAKMGEADTAAMQKLTSAAQTAFRQQMLQALLADRCHLRAHLESRQTPVYDLVVGKGGPKLTDAENDPDSHLRMGPDGKPLAGFAQFTKSATTVQGYTMSALANLLSQPFSGVGRPVIDKTGLTGTYNFTLGWSPQMNAVLPGATTNPAPDDDTGSIFTALQDLGLKLQPATGPIDAVVIDHVEKPTDN